MAKNNTKTAATKTFTMFKDLTPLITKAVDEHLHLDDLENCVSAYGIVNSSAFSKVKIKTTNGKPLDAERLRLLVMTAVALGEVPGVDSRLGRNGGIFRTKVKRAPKAAKKPAVKTTTKAANTPKKKAATEKPAETTAESTPSTAPVETTAQAPEVPVAKTGTDA